MRVFLICRGPPESKAPQGEKVCLERMEESAMLLARKDRP